MDALTAHLLAMKMPSSSFEHKEDLITRDSRVYQSYDINDPPPPEKGFTRFICISDTHGSTPSLPLGDVLIHAGDLSVYGRQKSFETTTQWLKSLPHPVKLVIAGNHDRLLDPDMCSGETDPEIYAAMRSQLSGQEAIESGVRYLEYQSTILSRESWKVFGSPSWPNGAFLPQKQGTPFYSAGAFQYYDQDAEDVNSLIPQDTDILITHGPPKGVLDLSKRGKVVGCPVLADRLFAPAARERSSSSSASRLHSRSAKPNRSPPKKLSTSTSTSIPPDCSSSSSSSSEVWLPHVRLHVFGHIHEAWGAKIIVRQPPPLSKSTSLDSAESQRASTTPKRAVETVFVNAAVQQYGTLPIIVDLRNPTTDLDSEAPAPATADSLESASRP